jgi:hypothetical protein
MKSTLKMQAPSAAKEGSGWRQFPTLEGTLGAEEHPAILNRIEKTCRQLNEVLQKGLEADKVRAKLAITAYGRSLDLLRLLTDIRDRSTAHR